MKDYDVQIDKIYAEYQDYDTPPYEYHLFLIDSKTREKLARIKFAGVVWRRLFGKEAW